MPEITYKGRAITVINEETTEADPVTQIPAMQLFVNSADVMRRCYAFDLEELEKYLIQNDRLVNFYAKPVASFSAEELRELQQRSPIIRAYVKTYLQKHSAFWDSISPETLKQMRLFLNRTGVIPRDGSFLANVKSKYSTSELQELQRAGVSIYDLARGKAFDQFKSYYRGLTDKEKKAIDNFPGIANELRLTGLVDSKGNPSLNSIFSLKAESCLGGTAGVCERIINTVEFAYQLKKMMEDGGDFVVTERISAVTADVHYKGQNVSVANTRTINGLPVDSIPSELLFVSESDTIGKRYAFNIEELEVQLIDSDSFINFYARPKDNFFVQDIIELQQRSPKIRVFMDRYLERQQMSLDMIRSETLKQMNLFLKRSAYFVMDDDFLNKVASEYTTTELSDLKLAGVSLHDLARGRALEEFKTYYNHLSKEEKRAIDTLPGIQKQLELYRMVDSKGVASLSNIFSLKADNSLRGSAGICERIVETVTFLKQLKDIPKEARGFEVTKELYAEILQEVNDFIASSSNTRFGISWDNQLF